MALRFRARAAGALLALSGCGGATVCRVSPDLALAASRPCAMPPCPPAPPLEGPGSDASPHQDVVVHEEKHGILDTHAYVTYEPGAPTPKSSPVVLFLHGFFDATPTVVDAMLRHIARKGFIVVYPSYGVPWAPGGWEDNAVTAFELALTAQDGPGRVHPDREHIAVVGHSIGGVLALRIAQRTGAKPDTRFPPPVAVVVLDGAGLSTPAYRFIPIDDLSAISPSTWLLVVMSQESFEARKDAPDACRIDSDPPAAACNAFGIARRAYAGTAQIPEDHKAAVVIPSDRRGEFTLRSEHNGTQGYCGSSPKPVDAIDTWGYWKLVDAALAQAVWGKQGDYVFADTDRMRSMGAWSDGRAAHRISPIGSCLTGGPC